MNTAIKAIGTGIWAIIFDEPIGISGAKSIIIEIDGRQPIGASIRKIDGGTVFAEIPASIIDGTRDLIGIETPAIITIGQQRRAGRIIIRSETTSSGDGEITADDTVPFICD